MFDSLSDWLASQLIVTAQSCRGDVLITEGQKLMQRVASEVPQLSNEERAQLLELLDTWITSSVIQGIDLSRNRDEAAIVEGLLGTIIGIVEDCA
jgi:hypothetical protein